MWRERERKKSKLDGVNEWFYSVYLVKNWTLGWWVFLPPLFEKPNCKRIFLFRRDYTRRRERLFPDHSSTRIWSMARPHVFSKLSLEENLRSTKHEKNNTRVVCQTGLPRFPGNMTRWSLLKVGAGSKVTVKKSRELHALWPRRLFFPKTRWRGFPNFSSRVQKKGTNPPPPLIFPG